MNKRYVIEARHLALGDYDCIGELSDDELECGSLKDHLKLNSCPKKHGKLGDIHYELYAQQEIIIKGTVEEADKKFTLEKKIDDYLSKMNIGISEKDFEYEIIYDEETNEPESIGDMKIVHEKFYYDNIEPFDSNNPLKRIFSVIRGEKV